MKISKEDLKQIQEDLKQPYTKFWKVVATKGVITRWWVDGHCPICGSYGDRGPYDWRWVARLVAAFLNFVQAHP